MQMDYNPLLFPRIQFKYELNETWHFYPVFILIVGEFFIFPNFLHDFKKRENLGKRSRKYDVMYNNTVNQIEEYR